MFAKLAIITLYFSSLLFTQVLAKQLSFSKQENEQSYQFNYRWLNSQQHEKALSFQLPKSVLFNQFRNFQSYQADMANAYINKHIVKAWRQNPQPQTALDLKKYRNSFRLELTAENNDALLAGKNTLSTLRKEITQQYFDEHHYHRFINYDGKLAIKPNHVAIAHQSTEHFKPLKSIVLSNVEVENIRNVTNYILNFSQSIPYSTLVSRTTSSGQGFNTPFKLLWENQGDCDSKVTFNAAILRALMPRVKIIMIFIKDHALLGIQVKPSANDKTLIHNQITYVLAEPTGPALWPLGTISQSSEQAILNGLYVAEIVK